METILKFFIVALCVTKLAALVLFLRHGKGMFASLWKKIRPRVGQLAPSDALHQEILDADSLGGHRARRSQDDRDRSAEVHPTETTIYFCQITLYRKVIRYAAQDKKRDKLKSALPNHGATETRSALPARS